MASDDEIKAAAAKYIAEDPGNKIRLFPDHDPETLKQALFSAYKHRSELSRVPDFIEGIAFALSAQTGKLAGSIIRSEFLAFADKELGKGKQ